MSSQMEIALQEARGWIGRESEISWGKYPVEYEPIRRWCRMVDCENPLYLDESYARKTAWGGVICPPVLITQFADGDVGAASEWPVSCREKQESEISPPLPVDRSLGVRRTFQFFKPVHVGERVGSRRKLLDICLKPTRFSPETFWVTTQVQCFNRQSELVSTLTRTGVRYKSQPSGRKKEAAAPSSPLPSTGYQLSRGNSWREAQVYFEEVAEGQELPEFSMCLDSLRFHLQSSGTQQFGLMHVDDKYAQGMGIPHVFLDHGFTQAALSKIVIDWMGKDGWLDMFDMEMKRMNHLGDTITIKGKVSRKFLKEDRGCVDCEVWIENPRYGGIATTGRAVAILPTLPA